jgi:hypothetical protein
MFTPGVLCLILASAVSTAPGDAEEFHRQLLHALLEQYCARPSGEEAISIRVESGNPERHPAPPDWSYSADVLVAWGAGNWRYRSVEHASRDYRHTHWTGSEWLILRPDEITIMPSQQLGLLHDTLAFVLRHDGPTFLGGRDVANFIQTAPLITLERRPDGAGAAFAFGSENEGRLHIEFDELPVPRLRSLSIEQWSADCKERLSFVRYAVDEFGEGEAAHVPLRARRDSWLSPGLNDAWGNLPVFRVVLERREHDLDGDFDLLSDLVQGKTTVIDQRGRISFVYGSREVVVDGRTFATTEALDDPLTVLFRLPSLLERAREGEQPAPDQGEVRMRAPIWHTVHCYASHGSLQIAPGESGRTLLIMTDKAASPPPTPAVSGPSGYRWDVGGWVNVYQANADAGRPARWHAELRVERDAERAVSSDDALVVAIAGQRPIRIRLDGSPWGR